MEILAFVIGTVVGTLIYKYLLKDKDFTFLKVRQNQKGGKNVTQIQIIK